MNTRLKQVGKQRGFGLIEVLITVVVVAVGLLAVASMQGTFISSSGELKARSEAVKLAEAKIEEMRNHAVQADYAAIASSANAESITGVNATFARSWAVTTPAGGPDRREVAVTVAWGQGPEESVNLVSQIAWTDVSKSLDYSTNGNGLAGRAPSPNNVSSVVSDVKFDSNQITEVGLNDGSGLSKYTDSAGDTYLVKSMTPDQNGNDLQAVIKFQGGVILSIRGAVYLGNVGSGNSPPISLTPTTAYPIAFSDLAYCVFPVPNTASDYICYFGGDCTLGGAGCPNNMTDYSAVQGGWYGRVGLTETSTADFQNKKVCFGEDVAGTGVETAATTARTYISRRLDANNNLVGSEGINQSFECQNFLIVDKRGNSYPCSSFSDYTIPGTSNKLAIASSSIERVLTPGQPNVVLAADSTQCGATSKYVVTGTIQGSQADQVTVLIDRNACLVSLSNGVYSYICTIETTNSNATITAFGGSVSPATQSITLNGTQITGADLVTGAQNQLNDCQTPWGTTVTNNTSITAYQAPSVPQGGQCVSEQRSCSQGTLSGSYVYETCSVQTSGDCLAPWGAVVADGSSVTAYQVDTVASSATCPGVSETRTCTSGTLSGSYTYQTCSVQQAVQCTVTVAGNVYKGQGSTPKPSENSVTVTATPGGSCTKAAASGNTYSYGCDIGTVTDGSSIAITGTSVTGAASVTVDCAGQSSLTTLGPELTTQ